jgi:hypothetical protein
MTEGLGYAVLENAWVTMYGTSEADRVAIRARHKRLGQLGVPLREGSGSGPRRKYSADDVNQLLLGFEFEQCAIGPKAVATLVRKYWRNYYRSAFAWIEREPDNPVFIWVAAAFVTDGLCAGEWQGIPKHIGWFALHSGPRQHRRRIFEEELLPRLTGDYEPVGGGRLDPRLSIINLSAQKTKLDAAIAAATREGATG